MYRRNMLVLSLIAVTFAGGCDAIATARSVAVKAARKQMKEEIEQIVEDAVSGAIDPDAFVPQMLDQ